MMIDANAWHAVEVAFGTISTVTLARVEMARRRATDASDKAEEAVRLSTPTANGFADDVRAGLKNVIDKVDGLQVDLSEVKDKVIAQEIAHAHLTGRLEGFLGRSERDIKP